jgi:dinuclear metal center YbgI/SA1388 family protein
MITLNTLSDFIDELLNISSFADYCVNGIQVEGSEEINKIITGVSASERLFQAAVDLNADAVIVHHGLFWRNSPHPMVLTGILGKRIKLLHKNNISLLAYHPPLDAHPEIGNNAMIANKIGLKNMSIVPAGTVEPLAAVGELQTALSFADFHQFADERLKTTGLALALGCRDVKKLFIVSGGGGRDYQNAADAGADVLITGELEEDSVRAAEELGIGLYAVGHYNSETLGINALGHRLQAQFDVKIKFVDVPNPV